MKSPKYPVISRVKERDTTFLVVELLASSSEFRTWFFNELVDDQINFQFLGVTRSVETHGRETDIRVEFDGDGQRYLALIENKIDAAFGEEQIADYHKRADQYVQEGRCDKAIVVLLAPSNRADSETRGHFDHAITYEEVHNRLRTSTHDSALFAEEVFRIALDQEGKTDKSTLMTTLAEQLEHGLQDISSDLGIQATENRIRIKSNDPDFPSAIWYEIRAKFSALGTIAPGIRVSTDDNDDLRAIYQLLKSRSEDLPLDSYRVQLADDHTKKQGMIECVLEVPGEPEAVSESQMQEVVNVMQTIIEHYHDQLQDVF